MSKDRSSLAINFIGQDQERRFRRRTYLLAAIFTVVVAGVATIGASASYRASTQGTSVLAQMESLPLIGGLSRLVTFTNETGNGTQTKNRLNVLVLGIGGEGHDGPQLTDTIMVASVDLEQKRVGLLSIPRDMAYPLGEGRFEKINAVNAYAEQDAPGEGAKRTGEAIGNLLDIHIDHVVRIDFSGFATFIDALGGIDVNVERSFTDPEFPTNDDKWMTVAFKKGPQHMDGATALMFTRSRHGNNGEGSDFARSRRQQLVMVAVREKLLSLNTLSDPSKLAQLYTTITKHLQTDLTPWDMLKLAPLAQNFSPKNINLQVLDDGVDGELVAANVNGAFMLFPKKPDWSQIRDIAQNPFATSTTAVASVKQTDPVKIEIKNGTLRTGFAAQIAAMVEKDGFEVTALGNAQHRGYERTMIYDLSGGKRPNDLARLRKTLSADISVTAPSYDKTTGAWVARTTYGNSLVDERLNTSSTAFLILLGEASYPLVAQP